MTPGRANGFIAELRRRNVIRMAGLYVVSAWLIVQVAETLLPIFATPEWVLKALVVLLAVGFIPALALSWVFELTPEGIRRETATAASPTPVDGTARKLDIAVILLLCLVGAITVGRWLDQPATHESGTGPTAEGFADGADSAQAGRSPVRQGEKSIAVLPFSDLSSERDQEYFSDGIAEEILNALAKVRDLKVAGRTSSFAFKGRNEDLREIGKTLGVENILEGSVRKQGDRVRITAQLIQVADGFHLWSETYDGELSDIFELQERIARAITDKLQVILRGDQERRLVPVATRNAEAYGMYLQASAIFHRREGARFADAIALLEEALRLDAGFARAHARLGAVHGLAPQYAGAELHASITAALSHAESAIALNPDLAEAYAVLAQGLSSVRDHVAARESYERALSIDPDDVLANFWMATYLINAGYLEQGDRYLDRVLEIDPLLPNALMWRGSRYVFEGNLVEGERLLRRADASGISNVGLGLAHLAERQGNQSEAFHQLARGLKVFMSAFAPEAPRIVAEGAFGNAAQRAAAVEMVEAYLAGDPDVVAGAAPYALIWLGEPGRALALAATVPTDSDAMLNFLLWSPVGAGARQLPAFSRFARDVGWAATWDRFGAPDLCRKEASGDYVCE
ncbi:tetratricopeptide repeat protein [Pseudomarimonas salicorniae]|uniref:TolB amino-terminal domain-containing protein n=1 Tax=Pseudomarimonas salicorniae TaxID=2933270 RepID=A0ABT0GDV3_9GAMM|nr:hypothetical protein [Lysobacter sp. CAU 1642]MCK7592730.1 hypothetical protein [Lysobacter sp. CAU 1642]